MSGRNEAPELEAAIDGDRYRMLVLDLDGTLLDRYRRVRWEDVQAVEALRAHGVHVTIATGRLYSGTRDIARRLSIRDTVACMNGSELVDTASDRVLSGRYLPPPVLHEARRLLMGAGVTTVLFGSDTIHYCPDALPHMRYLRSWSQRFTEWESIYDPGPWERRHDLLAVVAVGPWRAIDTVSRAITERVDLATTEVLAFPSGDGRRGFLMVRDRGEDKGTALRAMAAARQLDAAQCVCVGDWINDVPMLQSSALSFAMSGTPDWLQQAADHVLETPTQHGGAVVEVARRVWGVTI